MVPSLVPGTAAILLSAPERGNRRYFTATRHRGGDAVECRLPGRQPQSIVRLTEDGMRQRTCACVLLAVLASIATAGTARADDDKRFVVTVMFGAGMNTAQPPSNPANHHV